MFETTRWIMSNHDDPEYWLRNAILSNAMFPNASAAWQSWQTEVAQVSREESRKAGMRAIRVTVRIG